MAPKHSSKGSSPSAPRRTSPSRSSSVAESRRSVESVSSSRASKPRNTSASLHVSASEPRRSRHIMDVEQEMEQQELSNDGSVHTATTLGIPNVEAMPSDGANESTPVFREAFESTSSRSMRLPAPISSMEDGLLTMTKVSDNVSDSSSRTVVRVDTSEIVWQTSTNHALGGIVSSSQPLRPRPRSAQEENPASAEQKNLSGHHARTTSTDLAKLKYHDQQVALVRRQIAASLATTRPGDASGNVRRLHKSLGSCWTLCNDFAELYFQDQSREGQQSEAWNSCWKLCETLYDDKSAALPTSLGMILDSCRKFCQALFEARQVSSDDADSIFRVMWELQSHLYNAHNEELPDAYQERTLDFYMTLGQRLLKQKTSLPKDTEVLLHACWDLVEALFSLHRGTLSSEATDEEILRSAVQACWELCDQLRKGSTQLWPDSSTPQPPQAEFPLVLGHSRISSAEQARQSPTGATYPQQQFASYEYRPKDDDQFPATPTTIFEEDPMDDINDDNPPSIMILGPSPPSRRSKKKEPTSSSQISPSEISSRPTSSTVRAPSTTVVHLSTIRVLLVKVAVDLGYRVSSSSTAIGVSQNSTRRQGNESLIVFIRSLPSGSFGNQSWQVRLCEKYRAFVIGWPALIASINSGDGVAERLSLMQHSRQERTAAQIAESVQWMMNVEQYAWLQDLFLVVFGRLPDDNDLDEDEVVQV